MTVGWALLGPGRHADRNVAPQMVKADGVKPVAVLSRDRARAEAFAEVHGFARTYTMFDELLDDSNIDAIYDATPDACHANHAVAAALKGKHVLVEKPIAISVADCDRMIAACRDHGVHLGAVYQQRHQIAHQEARRRIATHEIGVVRMARVQVTLRPGAAINPPGGGNWRGDPNLRVGGALLSLADHAFDTLAYVVDQQIEQVAALTDATQTDPPDERVAALSLKLSGGALGHASASGAMPYGRRPVELHGDAGSLIIENSFADLSGPGDDARSSITRVNEAGKETQYFEPTETFRLEIEQFSRAIEGDVAPMTSGEEGRHALAISMACYEAIRRGTVADVLSHS